MGKLTHIKHIRGVKSLYGTFLYITLVPLIFYGIIITVYSFFSFKENVKTEVESSLKNVDVSVAAFYDEMYEGDYNVVLYNNEMECYKGNDLISGNNSFIETIKSECNVEISVFFYDTRVLTTITDENGDYYVGTGAAPLIVNEVIGKRQGGFFDNVTINKQAYYAYYEPIISNDGKTVLGMVGSAKPAKEVSDKAVKGIYKNIIIMLLALVVTGFFIMRFTSGIIDVIKKIMKFTASLASGDLSTELDPTVVNRHDELGEMGRLNIKLRGSLRKLIERDALTGIYNRRFGRNRIQALKEQGEKYCVAIGDIDFFKKFNDTFGHECGDAVLKEVARVLRESMNKYGCAVRWGGEEFLLIFDNITVVEADVITEEILQKVRDNRVVYDGMEHVVTMSFGVTNSLGQRNSDEDVNAADELLYIAKENGRNRVVSKESVDMPKDENGQNQ